MKSIKSNFTLFVGRSEFSCLNLIELLGNNFISLQENKMRVMEIIRTEEIDIVHLDDMPELVDNDRLFKDLYRNVCSFYF